MKRKRRWQTAKELSIVAVFGAIGCAWAFAYSAQIVALYH